jgi:hypothetical protein
MWIHVYDQASSLIRINLFEVTRIVFQESGDGRNFYHLNMMEEWNGNT